MKSQRRSFLASTPAITAGLTAVVAPGLSSVPDPRVARKNHEGVRCLSDYSNADGKPPGGKNSAVDETVALRRALAGGPGVVYVGPGFYRCGEVTVPAGVALIGAGASTVVRSSGPKQIFMQKNVSG